MRKMILLVMMILMAGMILSGAVSSADTAAPRIILYTFYRQMGWGDRVQIGWLDEDGVLRTVTGFDSDLKWPYKPEEQLEYLSRTEKSTGEAVLKHSDLFSVKSLVSTVEDQGSSSVPAANDAGTEKSFAVRYAANGEPVFILLGMSGDDMFENTDPNAQALYLLLRRMFPAVTSYAYDPLGMGPQGFTPVPVTDLIGLDPYALTNAEVKAFYVDCEEGNIPVDLTAKEKTELLSLLRSGKVIGKADCLVSTGGIYAYSFYDAEGSLIGTAEFEDGLLVMNDGRYYLGNF